MGVTSFDTLSEADPRKIELMTGRKYPFGNHIKESLLSLPPKIEMTLKEPEVQRKGKSKLQITLTRLSEPVAPPTKRHYAVVVCKGYYIFTYLRFSKHVMFQNLRFLFLYKCWSRGFSFS